MNTTNSNSTLQWCDGVIVGRCYTNYGWKYVILVINALSVVVNLVHIILMRRLASLRNTSYHFILQQISIADIYAAIPSATILCPVHKLYYGRDLRIAAIYAIIIEHCGMVRYNALCIASLERYLSICHPFSGDQLNCIDKLLDRRQKIKLLSIFIWIFGLGLSFVKNYEFRQYLCIMVGSGPTNRDSKVSRHFILVFIIIQTLFIVAFNMRVLVELRRIQRRTHVCEHGGFTKRASIYIIAITIAYYTCLLPACVGLILKSFGMQLWSYKWPLHMFYSLYGIFNVVIYGWVMKPYRSLLRKTLFSRWKNVSGRNRSVGPAGGEAWQIQDTAGNTTASQTKASTAMKGELSYRSTIAVTNRQAITNEIAITDLSRSDDLH